MLLREWPKNRNPASVMELDAPEHLERCTPATDTQNYYRQVFLSKEKARFKGGTQRWVGIVPRLLGRPGFQSWQGNPPLTMGHESLVEIPLSYQLTGSDADKDLLYGLRGFQLKSTLVGRRGPRGTP